MNQLRSTTAVINLGNLAHNIRVLRSLLPANHFFCPMVKANAYGHGAVQCSLALEEQGIRTFGVSLIEEGIELRQAGIGAEILIFGLFDRGATEIVEARLTPVISTFEQLDSLQAVVKSVLPVHIKIDTGMARLGFSVTEIDKVVAFFEKNPQLRPSGVLTHLHSGEDAHLPNGQTQKQLNQLRRAMTQFRKWQIVGHAWTTSSLMALHQNPKALSEFGARPGLGAYGVSTTLHDVALKPVMSLRSKIAKLNSLSAGQSVSYGATWTAKKSSVIGVVPIGYADGVHRILSNVGQALVGGKLVPIVGRVCMDYVMLDLSQLKDQNLMGAEVTFFGVDSAGQEYSAEKVAELAQTAPWEIFTSISARVPRQYVGGEG